MKITFILPGTPICGGVKVIFEYCRQLRRRGHEVYVIYPRFQLPKFSLGISYVKSIKWRLQSEKIPKFFHRDLASWFGISKYVIGAPNLSEKYVPDADIVVATFWSTAEIVHSLPSQKGEKFYLIQSYEIWGGPKDKVDTTWKMPLKKIVIASWLKDIAEKRFGGKVAGLVMNGVDLRQFYNDNKVWHRNKRIGMLYHPAEWKGVVDGVQAFNLAKQKHPEIKLIMFGTIRPDRKILKDTEFYLNPPQKKIRKIYCNCDIFISPSWTEGCQLPPMEAMACKSAVVATNVGGIPDYAVAGKTALVSSPKRPDLLAANIIKLLDDEELLRRISLAGYDHIRKFTWERAVKQLEKIFLNGRKVSTDQPMRHSENEIEGTRLDL